MMTHWTKEEMVGIPARELSNTDNLVQSPLVSVLMMTRNHQDYIVQAVESVVSQETGFPFEILIGEDFSLDNTRLECEKLQKKYPT